MHRYLRLLSPFERVHSLLEEIICSIRYCLGSDEVVHSHETALEETDAAISGLVDNFGSILNPGYIMCDRLSLAVNHLVSIVHQATNDESVRNDGDKNRNNPIDTVGSEATTKAGDIIANVEELEFILTKHRIVDNAEKSLKELLDILKRKKNQRQRQKRHLR